ncbi:hypothetical protein HJFPF1_05121 [Paramyrothecium foliicola]|nr:hypothetical protein HJFPF1_05121 [Paramyrothecium foliicola]
MAHYACADFAVLPWVQAKVGRDMSSEGFPAHVLAAAARNSAGQGGNAQHGQGNQSSESSK